MIETFQITNKEYTWLKIRGKTRQGNKNGLTENDDELDVAPRVVQHYFQREVKTKVIMIETGAVNDEQEPEKKEQQHSGGKVTSIGFKRKPSGECVYTFGATYQYKRGRTDGQTQFQYSNQAEMESELV